MLKFPASRLDPIYSVGRMALFRDAPSQKVETKKATNLSESLHGVIADQGKMPITKDNVFCSSVSHLSFDFSRYWRNRSPAGSKLGAPLVLQAVGSLG